MYENTKRRGKRDPQRSYNKHLQLDIRGEIEYKEKRNQITPRKDNIKGYYQEK